MTEERAHAEFSASGSQRWLSCPGSITLCRDLPEPPESEYAAEGTRAHACLEFLLKNRAKPISAKKIALRDYPADMVEHALSAMEWILAEYDGDGELLCETRVDSSPFTTTGQFGTLDAAVVREWGRLTVIDYKYGAGIAVDPEGHDGKGNPQLVYYALAISHVYHHNFSDVELVVIQPRAYHESGETVRRHVMTMPELLAWGKTFREGVMRTGERNAPLSAGSHCKFCPGAHICPELKGNAMRQAQIAFSDDKGVESLPEVTKAKAPDLGRMLDAAEKLEAWIKSLRDHAAHVLEHGGAVQGFKLVQKRSPRRWKDEDKTGAYARKLFGPQAFTVPKLLSPAQLEKVSKAQGKGEDWIGEHTISESSGTTLVRDTDKRPEVKPITQVFKELPAAKKVKTKFGE